MIVQKSITPPEKMQEGVQRDHVDTAVFDNIGLFVFDFDGVMTDNTVFVFQDGTEAVRCSRGDGMGITLLRRAGVPMLVLSTERNPVVQARCDKLQLECLHGIDDKLPVLQEIARTRGLAAEAIAYMGNDVNDLSCMRWVGLPIAVGDAHAAVLASARLVTRASGGRGAVREIADLILARLARSGRATGSFRKPV